MVFLTSTGFMNPDVYRLILENREDKYDRVCIIYTGIPEKKNHPIVQNSENFFKSKGIEEIRLLDVEFEDPSIIENYDLVFILGGNSAHLFYHMYRSGADKYILEHYENHKDLVGASAGAWFLSSGREYAEEFTFLGIDESYPEKVNSAGLNLIEGFLFPHYDMFCNRVDNLEEKLTEIEKMFSVEFIRLDNLDYIYSKN